MDRDNIDSISEALSEMFGELQNTIEKYAVNQLTQYTDNPEEWKKRQLLHQGQFKKALSKLISEFKKKINRPIETAFKELFKDAKDDIEDVVEDVENAKPKKVIERFKFSVNIELDNLSSQSLIGFKKIINSAGQEILQKKITSGDKLLNVINKAMDQGISDMFVTYKDGRKVHFKSYMEMNVRTTMQREALDYQYDAAKNSGVIFYLCSYHSDCANDHADYQGKVYVDENWESMVNDDEKEAIRKYISSHKLLTIQEVRDAKPFLTTRPNCRHKFRPITKGQALNNSNDELLNKFKMKRGEYDKEKYQNLQKQRQLERQVRKAKEKRDNTLIELENTKDEDAKKMLEQRLKREKSIVTKYQRQVNSLVKGNPYLERDYRRENYKAIVQDVGHKYNKDKK